MVADRSFVERSRVIVQAQFEDRNVGLGIDVLQHRPGCMVQTPSLVTTDLTLGDLGEYLGMSRRS